MLLPQTAAGKSTAVGITKKKKTTETTIWEPIGCGTSTDIYLRPSYVLQALKTAPADSTIRLSFKDNDKPVTMETGASLSLIMPVSA